MVNKSYLKTHMQNQHPDCNICKESFLTKSDLKDHTAKIHSSSSIRIVKEVLKEEKALKSLAKPFQEKSLNCDLCTFSAFSERYLWMHREKSHINDHAQYEMIGSKRDVTLVKTSSVSEPPKKKKFFEEITQEEAKEIKERSKQMDLKILEKRRKDKEKEHVAMIHLKDKNIETHKSDEKNMKEKNTKKKEDQERPTNQGSKLNDNKSEQNNVLVNKLKHPKLRKLPLAVQCLHPNSLEYMAEGNGACCVNCLAMWLFLNEKEMGPQTSWDLNTFIATYRGHFQPLLEFPMDIVIGVGGKSIRFEKGEEDSFFDTLVSSQEMSFMWRNGFDIQALTDMTNMPIEVTLFDTETNSVENVQTFQPTQNFPWNENDPTKPTKQKYNRKIMRLINYKNLHFNLIIHENDQIVQMLVPEKNTQQHVKERECVNEESVKINELTERLKKAEKSNKELKETLKICEDSKVKLKTDHKEAMEEVGKMKESVEKYKLEIKTLTQYKNMICKENPTTPASCVDQEAVQLPELLLQGPSPAPNQGAVKHPKLLVQGPPPAPYQGAVQRTEPLVQGPPPAPHQVLPQPTSKEPAPWTTVLPSNRKSPKRTGSGSESNQRNCPKCYFQSNCNEEMNNHYNMSHVPSGEKNTIAIRTEKLTCRNCKVEFENYWSMMNHRRDNHPTDRSCRYDLEDRCKHSAEECWYKHKSGRNPKIPTESSHINKCFECKMTFRNRNELMMHKKVEHVELCKPCEKYSKNECTRANTCWYPHTPNQDFHINQLNARPPINTSQ